MSWTHICGVDCRVERAAWPVEVALVPLLHRYGSGAGRSAITRVSQVCDTRLITQWKPPLLGVCKSLGMKADKVISLSRMVKVGEYKTSKLLRHSEKFIASMGFELVVTYSDSSLGHTGNVYKLAGYVRDGERTSKVYEDCLGRRTSPSKNGRKDTEAVMVGERVLTRWVKRL